MPNSVSKQLREAGIIRQEVTLLLRYEERIVKHYCMFCESRTPLFATQGRAFGVIYGHHIDPLSQTVPIGFHCPKCGAIYFVAALTQ